MSKELKAKYKEAIDVNGNASIWTITKVAYDIGFDGMDPAEGENMPTTIGIPDVGDNWEIWRDAYWEGVRDNKEAAMTAEADAAREFETYG